LGTSFPRLSGSCLATLHATTSRAFVPDIAECHRGWIVWRGWPSMANQGAIP
jgi:hypothetical protein